MLSNDDEKLIEMGLEAALKPVYDRLEDIAGPSSKTIGRMINAMLCTQMRSVVKVYGRATEMLNKAGIPLGPVPLKLLKPILDGAAVEEDEKMQDLWAALLANASAQTDEREVSPAFISVLGQLSPLDAHVFRTLEGRTDTTRYVGRTSELRFHFRGYTATQVSASLENLLHNSLLESEAIVISERSTATDRRRTDATDHDFRVTPFGIRFFQACEPPKAKT